ncbi:cartilage matrix protein-like [Ylistrum balloti]|uniref:cartilage matrix protein-like n=1 Tax=Ylistrum balloti TaxID=509963 RepID=UPI002905A163|nr:cartilage matrix protein-like [Ylistrum balloti]
MATQMCVHVMLIMVVGLSVGDTAFVCTPHPSDVVFILDSSSSIWPEDFVRQLNFVENITKIFDIGLLENQTRVGILTFSHKLKIELQLKDSHNKSDVMSAIRRVPHLTGGTSTARALWAVKNRMFTPINGARDRARKIVVVITDGMSHNRNATKMAAKDVRDRGVTIFAVGVGQDAEETELHYIASEPTIDHVFHVPSFRSLQTIQKHLSNQACKDPPVPEDTLQADSTDVADGCSGKPADVYFLLDSSSSIRKSENRKQLDFVKDVVAMFDIGENKTRIGLSTFSHKYRQEFDFQTHSDKKDLLEAIDKVSYLRGGTDTASALRNIRHQVFTPGVAREDVSHVLVVITDGYSRSPKSTAIEAALLHQMGVYVFAVGVTDDVDIKELTHISSNPEKGVKSFMFNVSTFDALESIKTVLAIRTCNVVDLQSVCKKDNDTDAVFLLDVSSLGSTVSYSIIDSINSASLNDHLKTNFQIGIFVHSCSDIPNKELSSVTKKVTPKQTSRYSELAGLVKKARLTGFLVQNGGRPIAKRVLFAFLDSELTQEAEIEIKMARDAGINFVFVTIGGGVDRKQVEPFVRGPQYIIEYDTSRPAQFAQVLGDMFCRGI